MNLGFWLLARFLFGIGAMGIAYLFIEACEKMKMTVSTGLSKGISKYSVFHTKIQGFSYRPFLYLCVCFLNTLKSIFIK